MRYLKTYTYYRESVVNYLPDILLEINDEFSWKADCWSVINSQEEKWFIIVERSCEEYNEEEEESDEFEVLRPTQSVIDGIMRSIDFMSGEGFINYKITLESSWGLLKTTHQTHIFLEPARYTKVGTGELINLEDISHLEFFADSFIRIEFWK
jgi:hypothetical protein